MFNPFKTDLAEFVHLSKDALHVHLGLLVFVVSMVLFRRTAASWVPWLCVLALELVNEFFDVFHWDHGTLDFSVTGGIKDIVNTMLWPTVIVLLARFAPKFWRPRA